MSVLPISAEKTINLNGIFSAIDFEGSRSIVVAVSGGSDSLALLYLLLDYRKSRPSFPEIVAVTIDHGLRPESRDEANYVAELCQKAGISHRILSWHGQKPDTGLSAKAREIRYKLLCDVARDAGAGIILTGHTLDDQVETFLMRSDRSVADSSERGQASMALATLLEREVWLVRPLLNMRREELRDYLRMLGVTWKDDPSNDSLKYERVRVRKSIQENDLDELQSKIKHKASKRLNLNAEVATALPSCVTVLGGIKAQINRENWYQQKPGVQELAVGVLLAIMGGQSFLPSATSCRKALKFIEEADTHSKLSIGRCIIETRPENTLLYREMRSIPTLTVEPGMSVIWDGRYRLTNAGKRSVIIDAYGVQGLAELKSRMDNVHGPSAQSSPAIVMNGVRHSPIFDDHGKLPEGLIIERYVGLFDNILVGYDQLLAQCVATMLKIPAYKRYPVNQINKN
ncbi:tRNA lysidine(34) synthetase TilS [Phyllobacterium sp. 22552]|uniref:tRNA lysidine(34) synthetase TilS n=1 Tax=Phyllobacterium sp. 22552 TaxID=3453941 RepID=UPI003F853077